MDYETVEAGVFGAGLRGLGLNIVVRDVRTTAAFLETVFGMGIHRLSADFAIVTYGDTVFQLHSDGTYASNPLLALLPENPPRGCGIELRLYDSDPEAEYQETVHKSNAIRRAAADAGRFSGSGRCRGRRRYDPATAHRQAARPARGLYPRS